MGDRNSVIARLALAALAAVTFNSDAASQTARPEGQQQAVREQEQELDSLFFTVERATELGVFFKAVKQAGLADTLKGAGPFTVFAPTDEAFAKLPAETLEDLFRPQNKERLRDLLISHIFPASATSGEIMKLNDALTLRRRALAVEAGGGIRVGGAAAVTRADIMATNGVLHLVDAVLVPQGDN